MANKGMVPIGSIITKRAIDDLKRSSPKVFKNENKSCDMMEIISWAMVQINQRMQHLSMTLPAAGRQLGL